MKAVITSGGKQYMVTKGDEITLDLHFDQKTVSFEPLAIFNEETTKIGRPRVNKAIVKAKVIDAAQGEKVTSIRFKPKKRVHVKKGHRQPQSTVKITEIVL